MHDSLRDRTQIAHAIVNHRNSFRHATILIAT
jgi:hypothetical protein